MTDLRKAAEMALEALEDVPLKPTEWSPAVEALRKALAQEEKPWVKSYCGGKPNYCTPEDEPVAWDGACVLGHCTSPAGCEDSNCCRANYPAPPKREFKCKNCGEIND